MKKLFGMIAMAAAIVACNKETAIQTAEQSAEKADGIKITATLAPKEDATKAIAESGSKLKTTWAADETLAILYEVNSEKKNAKATIKTVDGEGKATIEFEVVSGTANDTACQIIYPADAAKADNSGVKDAKDYLAAQDGTLNATLDVRVGAGTIQTTTPGLTVTTQPAPEYAIFKFTTKNSDASADISVSKLRVFIGNDEYVITPASPTSTLTVALPPVETSTMVGFTATKSDDSKIYSCAKSVTFAAAQYYKSTLKMNEVEGVLSGAFTVNSEGKKVRFSKGNLQAKIGTITSSTATASEWRFAENQYDYIGSFANNSWVDLFSWVGTSASKNTYGLITFTTNSQENHGNQTTDALKTDWGEKMGTGWRTLTKDEWTYLFNGRTSVTNRYCKATVADKAGVVLFPDSYTHPSGGGTAPTSTNKADAGYNTNSWNATQWTAMETDGAVFLPASGSRIGTSVSNAGSYGYYWSSTPHESGAGSAYYLYFVGSSVSPASYGVRYYGRSVRLVQNQ